MSDAVERLKMYVADTQSVLDRLEDAEKEIAFLERVLKQAVLSYGGRLDIDVTKAGEVKAAGPLEFGNGAVTIYGSAQSMFPDTKG